MSTDPTISTCWRFHAAAQAARARSARGGAWARPLRRLAALALALGAALTLEAAAASAAPLLLRVPQDVPDLQKAIAQIGNGGVIELKAGTYASPTRGWRLANLRKGFTVRAAAGATVVLDGGGSRQLLDYANSNLTRGAEVTFERLTFRGGSTTRSAYGPLRISKAEARFVACRFLDNAALDRADGGALRIADGSRVRLAGCELAGNRAQQRGGAISLIGSQAVLSRCRFSDNHVDIPNHRSNAAGGAVYVLDSTLLVFDSLFENNAAAYVGGALYAFGKWTAKPKVPAAEILLARSTVRDNRTQPNSRCTVDNTPLGGAMHVEDAVVARLQRTLIEGNEAPFGGGLSGFRARFELDGSVLLGNLAITSGGLLELGGATVLFSSDTPKDGAVNRPVAALAARRSVWQGRFGNTGATARNGGCLYTAGDTTRQYGEGGVAPLGGLAENRTVVDLARSALVDCDAEGNSKGQALGGGLYSRLTTVHLADSLVARSDARGTQGNGGGLLLTTESLLAIERSTLAGNVAELSGGAISVSGSELQIAGATFLANEVSPGTGEPIAESRGAAIYSMFRDDAQRPRSLTGVVSDSLFLGQIGLPAMDIDKDGTPYNDLRWNGNRFSDSAWGDKIYIVAPFHRQGLSASQLNNLVVTRKGAPSTDKSTVANVRLLGTQRAATLLALPAAGSPGAGVPPQLAWAWTGGSAQLGGQNLADRAGLVERPTAGPIELVVDGTLHAAAEIEAESCSGGPVLCLRADRFRVELRWETAAGEAGAGQAKVLTADRGSFGFTDPAIGDVTVRVIDSCAASGRFWVNANGNSGGRRVRFTVTDTWSGKAREYETAFGASFAPVRDRTTFNVCGLTAPPAVAATEMLAEER